MGQIIEVHTDLKMEHVKDLINRLLKFGDKLSIYGKRTMYGAVAYIETEEAALMEVEEEAYTYAEKKGLYVIRVAGRIASIINHKNFKPAKF